MPQLQVVDGSSESSGCGDCGVNTKIGLPRGRWRDRVRSDGGDDRQRQKEQLHGNNGGGGACNKKLKQVRQFEHLGSILSEDRR